MDWENFLRKRYDIDGKGNIDYPIYRDGKLVDKSSFREHREWNIKMFLEPKYQDFEIVSKILKTILICNGESSDVASQNSTNYDNMLLFKAIIYDNADESDLLIWEQRFRAKFN